MVILITLTGEGLELSSFIVGTSRIMLTEPESVLFIHENEVEKRVMTEFSYFSDKNSIRITSC